MKTLYIINTGRTFADVEEDFGNFDQWTLAVLGPLNIPVQTIFVDGPAMELPGTEMIAAVVITGSHSMVTDREPWSEKIIGWLPQVVKEGVPVLGICYGHQMLARAMGGEVCYHPGGIEAGTRTIAVFDAAASDRLFGELPKKFAGHTVHSQSVLTLPPGAIALAGNSHEPHHAVKYGENAWGVQFHPEFSPSIMMRYLRNMEGEIEKGGMDPKLLMNLVTDTPEAESLGRHFSRLVHEMALDQAA